MRLLCVDIRDRNQDVLKVRIAQPDSILEALQFWSALPRAMKIVRAVDISSDAELLEHGDRLEVIIQRGQETLLHLSYLNECKFMWRQMQQCFSLLPARWVHWKAKMLPSLLTGPVELLDEEIVFVESLDEEALPVDSILEASQFGLALPRAMKIVRAVDSCSDAEVLERSGRLEVIIQRGEETLLHLSDLNECKFVWRHMQRCFSLLPTRWVHTGGPM